MGSSAEETTESTQDSDEMYERLKEAIGEIYRQETEQKQKKEESMEILAEEIERTKEYAKIQEQAEESIEVSNEEPLEESIEGYDREVINIQKSKKKRIKAKKLELITDAEELTKHKHYEYSHAIGRKIDTQNIQKRDTKMKKKTDSLQKVAEKKVRVKAKKLELITDSEELPKHKHYEYSHTIGRKIDTESISKQDKKSNKKTKNVKISIQKKKPIRAKDLKLSPPQDTKSTTSESTTNSETQAKTVKQSEEITNKKAEKPIVKSSSKEITNIEYEKRIENKVSTELIEKYRDETNKRLFYNKKQTNDFRNWLKRQKEKQKKEKEESEKQTKEAKKSKEAWTILLETWINQTDEISKELKEEILRIINNYSDLREYYKRLYELLVKSFKKPITKAEKNELETLLEKFKDVSPIEKEIFRNLQAFRVFYYENIKWHQYLIKVHHKTFTSHLAQKLKKLKEKSELNWKELLSNNLELISKLNVDEKNIITLIITKRNITEQEIKKFSSILSRLDTEKLVEIFGQSFDQHTKNYVRWGWDFDQGVKRKIIYDYLSKIEFGKSIYSTEELVLEIKKQVRFLLSEFITNEKLSVEILNQKKNHIKSILQYSRKDPNYLLTKEILEMWKEQLKAKFSKEFVYFKNLFRKYEISNNILQKRYKIFLYHPSIKLDYFKNINTLEKAYWLGFIYADGSIYRINSKEEYDRFGIKLAAKDDILIDRFCKAIGFNLKYKKYYKRIRERKNKKIVYYKVKSEFRSKEFTDHLKILGVVPNKTFKIELPDLKNRELDLAFLLGFFDGDGRMGTTNLRSGNFNFLEQIRKKYNLPYKVYSDKDNTKGFTLSLGANLFNQMMDNYEKSLLRKRKTFLVNKFKTHEWKKDILENLVWKMPVYIIAKKYNLSQHTLSRLIAKYKIKLPSSSYWKDKNYLGKDKKANFSKFLEFFKYHSQEELKFFYKHFPYNAHSTIRSWVYKARKTRSFKEKKD